MLEPSFYASVFDQALVGEYLLSPSEDPVILAVNDAALRNAGRTRDDLIGRRLFDMYPQDPGDSGDTGVAALRRSLARVLATGQPDRLPAQRYPILVRQDDGHAVYEERFWHATNTPVLDADGKLMAIAHLAEDVTEPTRVAEALRRSSERQAFQLAVSDRLRDLDSPTQIVRTASAMLGERLAIARVTYVEVDDASGTFFQRHWAGRGHAELPSSSRRRLEEFGPVIVDTLRAGTPLVIEDVQTDPRTLVHARAYTSIGVRSNLAIPLLKSGRLHLVLSLQHDARRAWSETEIELATDVAERTWAAAENARAQEALREASRRKDEFLAMLAHELRNPLAPIRVAADLLGRRQLDEAALQKTSAIIARQVRHMTGLVDDLLDVSRVTRGQVTLDRGPLDMKAVVANAVEQARPLVEAKRHHLAIELPPVPARVDGDAKRLVQVVSNLLNNAAKYTSAGGQIRVSLEVDADQVRVHVKDNGIGIAPELQTQVFELFAQAERTPDRSQGGLGLGLALVKSLVELHHGTVTVLSEGADAGSCFTVCLPLLRDVDAPADEAAPAAAATRLPGLEVLVVDDNRDAAEMLQLLLHGAGHRVRVVHEAASALQAAALQPPQVGFIDIGLPGMDGFELVRRLRAQPATASALYVALTGYGQAADRSRALEAGFDEHLVKPAAPERLLEVLAQALPGTAAAR